MKLKDLTPDTRNANKGTPRGQQMIEDSLRSYGAGRSILVDKHLRIIAGNKTAENAGAIGIDDVIVVQTDGTKLVAVQRMDLDLETDKAAKELAVADNRAGQVSLEWDGGVLQDLDIDLSKFWTEDELKAVFAEVVPAELLTDEDAVPEVPEEPKTKLGDLYILGNHRLLCGDSVNILDVERLLNGAQTQMVYTDPPYGVAIVSSDSKVGGDKAFGKVGTIHKGMKAKPIIEANTYAPIIGDETTQTAIDAYSLCASLKVPVMIFWGGNYYAEALPPSSCWIVWDKDNGDSFFADAELAWTNQKTAVRIFKHQWNGLIKASERGEKRVHPTQKPVALAEWCFEHYGNVGDKVIDLFAGSGSTLVACEKTGRAGYLMEMSPAYCDVIVTRWENATGKKAVLQ